MTTTTAATKTKTCDDCGKTGLFWKKSARGKFYLAETVRMTGRVPGRPSGSFNTTAPHYLSCPGKQWRPEPLSTSAQEGQTLVGKPHTVVENPATHVHNYQPWRQSAGSLVTGYWCAGCNDYQID